MAMDKRSLKRVARGLISLGERAGVHVQPVHYYADVPDRRWLRANRSLWAKPLVPAGQDWDLDAHLLWLEKRCSPHVEEVSGLDAYEADTRSHFGPGYGPIEAQVLHCVIRYDAPPRVVEVGSGLSTATMVRASRRNVDEGSPGSRIICIEPNPHAGLRNLDVDLLELPAQAVDLDVFLGLEAGDLLFIDSTHAVRTGSEVVRLYLEVLPRLAPGVLVHIHDIFLPYLFHPNVLAEIFDWQETALLAALLTGNESLEVLACLSALVLDRPERLRDVLPNLLPRRVESGIQVDGVGHYPSSVWLCTR
jgi:predicted O-methyltransferase YrrM